MFAEGTEDGQELARRLGRPFENLWDLLGYLKRVEPGLDLVDGGECALIAEEADWRRNR